MFEVYFARLILKTRLTISNILTLTFKTLYACIYKYKIKQPRSKNQFYICVKKKIRRNTFSNSYVSTNIKLVLRAQL